LHSVVQHLRPYGWRNGLRLLLLKCRASYPQGQAENWTAHSGLPLQRRAHIYVLPSLCFVPDGPRTQSHREVNNLQQDCTLFITVLSLMRNPLFLVINEEVFDDRLIFLALNYMWSVSLDVLSWPQIEALVKLSIESMVCEFFLIVIML